MTDNAVPYFSELSERQINWQKNTLIVGPPYTIASGLAVSGSGGGHANMLQTGDGEWTLIFGTLANIQLISFSPTQT